MTTSLRHHETRWSLVLASCIRELIDEFAKIFQSGQLDHGLVANNDRRASCLIEHPHRHGDP